MNYQELRKEHSKVLLSHIVYLCIVILAFILLKSVEKTLPAGLFTAICFAVIALVIFCYFLICARLSNVYDADVQKFFAANSLKGRMTYDEITAEPHVSRESLLESGLIGKTVPQYVLTRRQINGEKDRVKIQLNEIEYSVPQENGSVPQTKAVYLLLHDPDADAKELCLLENRLVTGVIGAKRETILKRLEQCAGDSGCSFRISGKDGYLLIPGRALTVPTSLWRPVSEQRLTADPIPELEDFIELLQSA